MTGKNLGEILLEQGIISRDSLDRALQIQSRRLGEILIEERLADPAAIAQALKFQARGKSSRRSSRLSIEATALDEVLRRLEGIEDQLGSTRPQSHSLQSALIAVRQSIEMMLLGPIETLFEKARWITNQTAAELGKSVNIVCEGGGLVIDRALIDELSDMILHLIRNAIDHGIEPLGTRQASGKPEAGVIQLGVASFGGRLHLTLSDDGRGVNLESVFRKACGKGLLQGTRDQISDHDLYRLLFTPGFSTAEGVSSLSGRGVGLDVVEASVIRLGGEVTVRSTEGTGATFRIIVPLPYSRISIVPLRVGAEWIAVNAAEIASIEKATSTEGLFSAASLFGEECALPPVHKSILKVECLAGSRWAFDEVGQPEDVTVREAGSFAKGSHGVIGGARMRNGQSVLVVDLNLLAGIVTV